MLQLDLSLHKVISKVTSYYNAAKIALDNNTDQLRYSKHVIRLYWSSDDTFQSRINKNTFLHVQVIALRHFLLLEECHMSPFVFLTRPSSDAWTIVVTHILRPKTHC